MAQQLYDVVFEPAAVFVMRAPMTTLKHFLDLRTTWRSNGSRTKPRTVEFVLFTTIVNGAATSIASSGPAAISAKPAPISTPPNCWGLR